jgi:hypothetical protein
MRRFAALLALALCIALPGSAFAATSKGDTLETLTVASTISMTVDASVTYSALQGNEYDANSTVTIVGSNNPTGLTITAKADPFVTGGGIVIPTTQRDFYCSNIPDDTSPLKCAAIGAQRGKFLDATTAVPIAGATHGIANQSVAIQMSIPAAQFTVGGTYTSAVHYTASTNP